MTEEVPLDCIYVAASSHDARFTRICIASVRYFYPQVPIRLLVGGRLQRGLLSELERYWRVNAAALEDGEYGWGFVKLEPLFGTAGERFLVLDSDTVLTGEVISKWSESAAPFCVDDEQQSEEDTRRLYYDWQRLSEIDTLAQAPAFLFNSGQWFGTSGILTREDFAPWIDWVMPRRLHHPNLFMPGDQGVLNYVLNRKSQLEGLHVDRRKIMCWPGHSLNGLDAASIGERICPAFVVHWAGMKSMWLKNMVGADLLAFFERYYYDNTPGGRLRQINNNISTLTALLFEAAFTKVRLAARKIASGR
jgi:hypothetical protein